MEDATTFLWSSRNYQDDIFIRWPLGPSSAAKGPHPYAPLGKDGITASANVYGHIMQMSRFLGVGLSGFLCVDPNLPKPYYVNDRMADLINLSKDSQRGFRLDPVDSTQFRRPPLMGFMYDRWPRYVYTNSILKRKAAAEGDTDGIGQNLVAADVAMSIQIFSSGGHHVQKYLIHIDDDGIRNNIIKNKHVRLVPDLCIRDLNVIHSSGFGDSVGLAQKRAS